MSSTVFTPTQQHLLKLFSLDNSEEYALEVKEALTKHFQQRLDAEADRLWNDGTLNQQRLDEIMNEDLHCGIHV